MNKKTPFIIYAEATPNPSVMKFVSNQILTRKSQEYLNVKDTAEGTLLRKLFSFPFVKEIFISTNYISIRKHDSIDWVDVTNQIRIFIQEELNNQIKVDKLTNKKIDTQPSKSKLILEIEKVIDDNIRTNIQMDGGDIEVISCENGVLKLLLQGACSGCPSSQITLKNGIEHLLKQQFPKRIKEVIAIND